jgi:hypothetical protein
MMPSVGERPVLMDWAQAGGGGWRCNLRVVGAVGGQTVCGEVAGLPI